ncbi:uncharacterized protein LOC135121714 [Zophobas morio]|uniref:uncharacterized protein LOC135121714 n=1 Tax=Zophobas morio TaxID=2755281 RepID=UPI003083EAE8
MECCRRVSISKAQLQARDCLLRIKLEYPSNITIALITQEGKLLVKEGKDEVMQSFVDKVNMQRILRWKEAASSLTSSILAMDILESIHIKGETYLLSAYPMNRFFLLTIAKMHAEELEDFDTALLDKKVKILINELQLLLQNFIVKD